jgi:hypothetical protein
LRVGDPRWLGDPSVPSFDIAVPAGVFPVKADIVTLPEGSVVGAVYVVFDEAKFVEAEGGGYCERMETISVESGAVAFADPGAEAVAPGVLSDEYNAGMRERGWGVAVLWEGRAVAATAGFGAGQYGVWWWYGPNLSTDPFQDIAALGVVTLSERNPS